MTFVIAVGITLTLATIGFTLGFRRSLAVAGGSRRPMHSLPSYHGLYVALCAMLPAIVFLLVALAAETPVIHQFVLAKLPDSMVEDTGRDRSLVVARIERIAGQTDVVGEIAPEEKEAAARYSWMRTAADWIVVIGTGGLAAGGLAFALPRLRPQFRARNRSETILTGLLLLCAAVAVLTTVGIVLSVLFESIRFFGRVPMTEFLFGLEWNAQTAIREGQVAGAGTFGIIPLLVGTLLIALVAMAVAGPIGLLAAIYLVEFAQPKVRATAKPLVEILAGVPTVVYGYFAAITVAPFISDVGTALGLSVSSQSALAAGLVMGIMIIPFVSSLSDDVISSVPRKLRDGAYSCGATQGETILKIVLPAALPGIVSAFILAISRAIGETMIVLMAAGLYANLTFNPLEAVTTVTVQIATLLTGDQRFDSAKTLSAFALGLVLFLITLCLNVVALKVVERYREKYE